MRATGLVIFSVILFPTCRSSIELLHECGSLFERSSEYLRNMKQFAPNHAGVIETLLEVESTDSEKMETFKSMSEDHIVSGADILAVVNTADNMHAVFSELANEFAVFSFVDSWHQILVKATPAKYASSNKRQLLNQLALMTECAHLYRATMALLSETERAGDLPKDLFDKVSLMRIMMSSREGLMDTFSKMTVELLTKESRMRGSALLELGKMGSNMYGPLVEILNGFGSHVHSKLNVFTRFVSQWKLFKAKADLLTLKVRRDATNFSNSMTSTTVGPATISDEERQKLIEELIRSDEKPSSSAQKPEKQKSKKPEVQSPKTSTTTPTVAATTVQPVMEFEDSGDWKQVRAKKTLKAQTRSQDPSGNSASTGSKKNSKKSATTTARTTVHSPSTFSTMTTTTTTVSSTTSASTTVSSTASASTTDSSTTTTTTTKTTVSSTTTTTIATVDPNQRIGRGRRREEFRTRPPMPFPLVDPLARNLCQMVDQSAYGMTDIAIACDQVFQFAPNERMQYQAIQTRNQIEFIRQMIVNLRYSAGELVNMAQELTTEFPH
jgi:hypothetical protein